MKLTKSDLFKSWVSETNDINNGNKLPATVYDYFEETSNKMFGTRRRKYHLPIKELMEYMKELGVTHYFSNEILGMSIMHRTMEMQNLVSARRRAFLKLYAKENNIRVIEK